MKKTKAVINFTQYTDAILPHTAKEIVQSMTDASATFPSPPVAMGALLTLATTYEEKLVNKASRAKADVTAFRLARTELEEALAKVGGYVNLTADGDGPTVQLSGFPSYGGEQPPPAPLPAAPTEVRIKHGTVGGTIVVQFKPDRKRAISEIQLNTGDPNNEGGWVHAVSTTGEKAGITGLTVGSTQWVRVRTYGAGNTPGAWSDPAKITVV